MTRATTTAPPARAHAMPAPADTLADTLAHHLAPAAPQPGRTAALGRQLLARAQASRSAHRDLLTVRREDAPWEPAAAGVRQRVVWPGDAQAPRLLLAELAPGAGLPWPQDTLAQELLVTAGSLHCRGEGPAEPSASLAAALSAGWFAVLHAAATPAWLAGPGGATLLLRQRGTRQSGLAPDEAAWWQAAAQARPARPPDGPWAELAPGIRWRPLLEAGRMCSMLIDVDAGTVLPDHGHGHDEDCLMLAGDLFLGDILLRPGDYQRARRGTTHQQMHSESGGLFYVHGLMPDMGGAGLP